MATQLWDTELFTVAKTSGAVEIRQDDATLAPLTWISFRNLHTKLYNFPHLNGTPGIIIDVKWRKLRDKY
jgi:hypothetical protein